MIEPLIAHTLLYLILALSIVLVLFGLPGTWIIVAAAFGYTAVGGQLGMPGDAYRIIAFLVFTALVAELFDFIISVLGAKKMAVSNGAIICSIIGSLVGAIVGVPLPFIGSFAGLMAGAFLGAFFYEIFRQTSTHQALKVAGAVLLSRIIATFFKTAIACLMAAYVVYETF